MDFGPRKTSTEVQMGMPALIYRRQKVARRPSPRHVLPSSSEVDPPCCAGSDRM